jgi:hypothetical protein
MYVVIHMYMETMLGISLNSYLYLKLAKMLSFLLSPVSFSTKLENKKVEQVLPRSGGGWGRWGGGPNNVYTCE